MWHHPLVVFYTPYLKPWTCRKPDCGTQARICSRFMDFCSVCIFWYGCCIFPCVQTYRIKNKMANSWAMANGHRVRAGDLYWQNDRWRSKAAFTFRQTRSEAICRVPMVERNTGLLVLSSESFCLCYIRKTANLWSDGKSDTCRKNNKQQKVMWR